jgi:hypothetical protein
VSEDDPKPVTRESVHDALKAAYDAVVNATHVPHRHVVSPRAMERKGWVRCADCFGPVWLADDPRCPHGNVSGLCTACANGIDPATGDVA